MKSITERPKHDRLSNIRTMEQLVAFAKGKKVVGFGASRERDELWESAFDIFNFAYFCDNDKRRWGGLHHGRDIKEPAVLAVENADELLVIVFTHVRHKDSIERQLTSLGVKNYLFHFALNPMYGPAFQGGYTFIDRSGGHSRLLMILAGYKEFMGEVFFSRITRFTPQYTDVCVTVAGKDSAYIMEKCEENSWSYLSTKENRIGLTQNLAIKLHSKADIIHKLDEDMFISEDYFHALESFYEQIDMSNLWRPGFIAPLIPVSLCGYPLFLDKMGLTEEYVASLGSLTASLGVTAALRDDVVQFLWDHSLPFDSVAQRIRSNRTPYAVSPFRFSIGAIMYKRAIWQGMGGFSFQEEGRLGDDEIELCTYCMMNGLAVYIDTNTLAGHLAFGAQTEFMKDYFLKNKASFEIQRNIR